MRTPQSERSRRGFTPGCDQLETREVLSTNTFVIAAYEDVLGRTPAQGEIRNWVKAINNGQLSRQGFAWTLYNSPEHRGQQVDQLYAEVLDRAADPAGRQVHVNELLDGVNILDVKQYFLTSTEYQNKHATNEAFVTAVYQDVLYRDPDPIGQSASLAALSTGTPRSAISDGLIWSNEGILYQVDTLYVDYLHRLGDAQGLETYGSVVQTGQYYLDDIATILIASPEFERIHKGAPG